MHTKLKKACWFLTDLTG